MIDSPTDTSLTKGREQSAPGMPHADTHTPLHGPTGGVPSHKAISDNTSPLLREPHILSSPDIQKAIGSPLGPRGKLVNPTNHRYA
eukprot:scaffold5110_cov122-Isochrysis_galbana.AAC.3